jgi:hypothetical protein
MDKQLIEKTKKLIKESNLSQEAKSQLFSLMDFINYPEVKERILKILDTEEKITKLEIQYLKKLEERLRGSDIFGYSKSGMVIPSNTRQNLNNQQSNTVTPQPINTSTPIQNQNNQPVNTQINPAVNPV